MILQGKFFSTLKNEGCKQFFKIGKYRNVEKEKKITQSYSLESIIQQTHPRAFPKNLSCVRA